MRDICYGICYYNQKMAGELKRLVKDGWKAGDMFLIGAAYCGLAELCDSLDDEKGVFSYVLRAVTYLKDTSAYALYYAKGSGKNAIYQQVRSPDADEKTYLII